LVMVRKKMTTYVDEDLLRSAKILAARRDGKIYEVFEEALRRYLEEPDGAEASLAEALSERRSGRLPGVPRKEAVKLPEGGTLSEAVLAEREERGY
jgi:hypothetical protein